MLPLSSFISFIYLPSSHWRRIMFKSLVVIIPLLPILYLLSFIILVSSLLSMLADHRSIVHHYHSWIIVIACHQWVRYHAIILPSSSIFSSFPLSSHRFIYISIIVIGFVSSLSAPRLCSCSYHLSLLHLIHHHCELWPSECCYRLYRLCARCHCVLAGSSR